MSGKYKFAVAAAAFVVFVVFVAESESANILCVFTSASPSHLIIHMAHARAMAERAHNVTVVTTLPLKDKNPRYHHIFIPPSEARYKEMENMKTELAESQTAFESMRASFKSVGVFGHIMYDAIKDKQFQDLMHNRDNKFDLIIIGYFFSDYQFGLAEHFKCPIVLSWMAMSNRFVDQIVGNPMEVAYVPASPMTGTPDFLSFKGRLSNFVMGAVTATFAFVMNRQMTGHYNDLFPGPKYPPLEEATKKISLVLCNSHFSEGIIRPNVPAFIEVGGIQIKDKPDPLPKDLKEIVDASSEHGAILLSFGSNLASGDLRPQALKSIYDVLASLKQTVIWKWVGEKKPGNAPNIQYISWLPQDDLLAHPNLKLFITHAGKGSVAESQYHGVPMVAIPMFADQPGNADQLANAGFGTKLDYNALTTEALRDAVLEVLNNPIYTENVKRFSELYRDRPMTAKETAVFWLEYVIRHKGAYHMQSPLVHLNSLQYMSVDVVAFLLLMAYIVLKLVLIPTKFMMRKICGAMCSKSKKQKKA